jgi:hypothetical protein
MGPRIGIAGLRISRYFATGSRMMAIDWLDAADGAVKEVARIVKPIRERWPHVRILLRADSDLPGKTGWLGARQMARNSYSV